MSNHDKPQLYVIAGPNGAGKSTFTDLIVPPDTIVINGDEIAKRYYGDLNRANMFIGHHINQAKELRKNISIETNFVYPDEIKDYMEYKEYGFEINLYYIALKDLQESQLRVHERSTNGGHFVDGYMRELNFNVGKENAIANAHHFDTVTLIANSLEYNDTLFASIKKEVILKNEQAPQWAKELINEFEIAIKKDNGIDNSIGRKR